MLAEIYCRMRYSGVLYERMGATGLRLLKDTFLKGLLLLHGIGQYLMQSPGTMIDFALRRYVQLQKFAADSSQSVVGQQVEIPKTSPASPMLSGSAQNVAQYNCSNAVWIGTDALMMQIASKHNPTWWQLYRAGTPSKLQQWTTYRTHHPRAGVGVNPQHTLSGRKGSVKRFWSRTTQR